MATWRKPCWLGVHEEVSRDNPATYFTDEDVFLTARLSPDVLPYNHIAAEFSVENIWHPNPCGMHKAWTSGCAANAFFSDDQLRQLLKAVAEPELGAHACSPDEEHGECLSPFEVKFVEGRWQMLPVTLSEGGGGGGG